MERHQLFWMAPKRNDTGLCVPSLLTEILQFSNNLRAFRGCVCAVANIYLTLSQTGANSPRQSFFLNQMKKLFTFLASAALCLLPAAASAADTQTIDGIEYQFNASTETYTVAGPASDPTSQVALLAMVDGYPVTSIAENAFVTSLITSLSMPWTITEIGEGAFKSCSYLEHVTLSPSITEIPNYCFTVTPLKECVVPEGVTTIGLSAFEGCSSLTSLILPSTLTTVNACCFSVGHKSCVITCYAATPPNADPQTFSGYSGKVAVPSASVDAYKAASGWSAVAERIEAIPTPTWPVTLDGVTYDSTTGSGSAYVTGGTSNTTCNVTVQKMVQGLQVTSISRSAFRLNSSITTVAVPATVTEIGDYAFSSCSDLTAVSLPSGLTQIADDLFSHCTKLAKCDIPEGVTTIGSRAFNDCRQLLSLTLPATVNNLGTNCFDGMGNDAGSDATTLTCLAATPPNADPHTFTGYTGKVAVPSASVDAYKAATGWSTVASQIEAIATPTWPVTIGGVTYNSSPDSGTAYVTGSTGNNPTGNVTIQKEVLGLPVTSIDADAFSNCSGLESVYIPETVKSIGRSAFKGCSKLSSVSIEGEGLETIGNQAFMECSSLTEITIPRSVTAIYQNVFSGCIRLENVTLPETITYIGSGAFQDCGQLQSIVLPEQLMSIGENAFNGCTGLTSVTLNDGLQRIDAYAFSGCNRLKEITVPENVTSIASYAFYHCTNLERVYIKGQIRSINSSTFADCPELSAIVLPATLDQIVDNAFSGSNALERVILFGAPAEFRQPNATASTQTIDDIFGAGAKFYVPSSLEVQYTEGITEWASAELQTYSFSMTVSPDEVQSLAVGKSQKLTAGFSVKRHSDVEEIVVPEFSTILGQAIWTSGNNSVATVSADGTVTGIREGETTIQVETPYSRTQTSGTSDQNTVLPTVYATCPVHVTVSTGIETAVSDTAAPKVYVANGEVRIEGTEPGAEVKVYDLSGRCLLTTGEHTFAAPGNGGVCILTVGGRTYKFAL